MIETDLMDVFDKLPKMVIGQGTYKVNSDFGSHKDLLRYMNSERKEKGGVS